MKKSSRCLLGVGRFVVVLIGVEEARADDTDAALAPATENVEKPEMAPLPASPAETRRGFGRNGSVVLDEIIGLGFAGLGSTATGTPLLTGWVRYVDAKSESGGISGRTSMLAFAPSLDVFIAPRLSLGGQVTAFHSQTRVQYTASSTGGGLEPRIGWVMPITEDLAFWPRAFASIAYSHARFEGLGVGALGGIRGGSTNTGHTVAWGAGVDAIMAATIHKTVALTFGPRISYVKSDATGAPPVLGSSNTSISASVHGGLALVF